MPDGSQGERGGVNFDVNNSGANIGISVGSVDYRNAFAGAHIGPHVESTGGININIGTQDGRGERQNIAAQRDARSDQPEAAALRPRTEQELAQIHTDPIPFAYNGQTYDARHVLAAQEVADYLTIAAAPDGQNLETRLVVLRVKIQTLMEQAIDKGVVPPLPPEEPDHTPQPRPHVDREPMVTVYSLTDVEFTTAVQRLRQAFPLSGTQRPTDDQIRAIVEQEILKRGDGAPVPGDATVRTLEQIRAAVEAPETNVGATYRISVEEFGYIIANELQQDTTITLANVEDKVREAVHKCIAEYATRTIPSDARVYTLVDFKRELGLEKEPAQGHTLTEEGFAWIVEEMLKPGSGVLDFDQVTDAVIAQFEARIPNSHKVTGAAQAKLYNLEAFKTALQEGYARQQEKEWNKIVPLTPAKLYAVLYGLWSQRISPDNVLLSNVQSVMIDIDRNWKEPADSKAVPVDYAYRQIANEYKTFDPNRRETNEDESTKGYFTPNEFTLIILRLRNVMRKSADDVTIGDVNRMKIPDDRVDKDRSQARQYTLKEIKDALRQPSA